MSGVNTDMSKGMKNLVPESFIVVDINVEVAIGLMAEEEYMDKIFLESD